MSVTESIRVSYVFFVNLEELLLEIVKLIGRA